MNELTELLRTEFTFAMTNVHTAMPGVIIKYDAKTRRADIQPSIQRKLPDGTFLPFPVIPEVPVIFPGNRKYIFHFPLEKDDEVLLISSERGTDVWKETGGKEVKENDPRRFDAQDCFAIPGLQAVDFIPVEEEGLHIVCEKKNKISIDDKKITLTQDKLTVTLKGNKISVKNTGKSLFALIDTLIKTIEGMKTVGSPAQHIVSPDDVTKLEKLDIDFAELVED
jgi:hypothetical protein